MANNNSQEFTKDAARQLLADLTATIRDSVINARDSEGDTFHHVSAETAADTIYQVDKISEEAIVEWFGQKWPENWPVEIVMEGIEDGDNLTFPEGTPVDQTEWKCIMDPIDGTRNIMYDKRSAWALAALAPQRGNDNSLLDIDIASMAEIPTSKQWRADEVSGYRGGGLVTEAYNVLDKTRSPIKLAPSGAGDFKHGFASFARFFPEGKQLMASFEEQIWGEMYGLGKSASPLVFDDQYISTGGQMYEILCGHDRMLGDLRPLAFNKLGMKRSLCCHPYDICTYILLEEAGAVIERHDGGPLDAPLDTTSPVTWIGFANIALADQIRPVIHKAIKEHF